MFILIITDTQKRADEINRSLPEPGVDYKILAARKQTQLLGINHNGQRPNVLIEKYNRFEDAEATHYWRENGLKPILDKNCVII